MIEIEAVSVALVLPDGRHVAQRRDPNAEFSPGLLAYFGGQKEDADICSHHGAIRELEEELGHEVPLSVVGSFSHFGPAHGFKMVAIHGYLGVLTKIPEIVHEGIGAEAHHPNALLAREDVPSTTKHLTRMIMEKRWL